VRILRVRNGSRQLVDVPINVTDTQRRIEVTTAAIRPVLTLPAGATIAARDVDGNGGSAGLMLALAVYDRFANEPLIGDRSVSGTGTIGLDGAVGVIDGMRQKVIAAEEAGISLFLVPAPQYEEAVVSTRGFMQIIPVSSVSDAIEVLRELP
jgi:PDZ domain-containing protein